MLTFDPAVNQGTGASGRRYQGRILTVDGLNWVQMRCSQEVGGRQTMISPGVTGSSVSWSQFVAVRGSENQLSAEGWALRAPG